LKLPNPDRAVVDTAKLRLYCLDPTHPVGKHKAIVFSAALGLTAGDADWLRDRLLEAAFAEAEALGGNQFGSLYATDSELRTASGRATVRCGWIVRAGEDFPRLTTCYVKSRYL